MSIKTTESLALKYRPSRLEQIYGQDDVVDQLRGMFKKKTVNQSFLITGPTGTGKTTLARMVAHYVNCENFNHEECSPCGECDYCKAVAERRYMDVEELNFSDARGIDDARRVLESTQFAPQNANYLVYILDEFQGATEPAQNAILKHLEEPPKHVIFMILTTDPRKIIDTVKTRCTSLPLNKVADDALVAFLKHVTKLEKKTFISDTIYRRIALNANGRVRQAIQALESVINTIEGSDSFNQTDIEKIDSIIGRFVDTPETNFYQYLIEGVYSGKYASSLESALTLVSSAKSDNYQYLFSNLLTYHMQSVYMLVDPRRNRPTLTGDAGYKRWQQTIIAAAAERKLFLTLQSASEISEILLDLINKAGTFQHNVRHIFTVATLKMLGSVQAHKDKANAAGSVFHKIHAVAEEESDRDIETNMEVLNQLDSKKAVNE